jgi:hypothetical protein
MSNLDPQVPYQPWSQKLQNLIDVSDDIVTMMSGTDDARLLALVANSATIGVTLPTGIATGLSATGTATDHVYLAGTYSNAIKIGGVAGVGLYINKTANTAAAIKSHCHMLATDGVDAPNFVANEFKGEFLSTGTSHATMDGIAAHFHMAASSTGILRSILGVAYLDSGKTLSGTDYTDSGWLNAGTFVADVSGVINGTGVVVNGLYAGIGSCQLGTLTACKYLTSLWVTSNSLTTLSSGQSSLILVDNPAGTGKQAVNFGIRMESGSLITTGLSFDGQYDKCIDFSEVNPDFGSQEDALIAIGTYTSAITIADTGASFIPIQVNLSSTGNVSSAGNQVAAARLRVDSDTNAQANTAISVLQIRSDLATNVYAATGISGSTNISANIALPTASLQGIYYQITGPGAVTCPNEPNVMEIGYHQSSGGGGFNAVARFDVNATGCSITNIARLKNYAGTVTNGLSIEGAMTNGIALSGTSMSKGIDFASATLVGDDADNAFISIGSWNDAYVVGTHTEHYVPIQVHLHSNTSVGKDIAAMRLRVDTSAANTLNYLSVQEIRSSVSHDCAAIGTFGAGLSIDDNMSVVVFQLLEAVKLPILLATRRLCFRLVTGIHHRRKA